MAPLGPRIMPLASMLKSRGYIVAALVFLIAFVAIVIDSYCKLGILQQMFIDVSQWIKENVLF